jgi:hypothetical protein
MQSISLRYLSRRIFSESSVRINWLWSGHRGIVFRFPKGGRDYSLLRIIQTSSGAHPASYLMGTDDIYRGQSTRVVKMTPDCHVVWILRMRGVVSPLLRMPSWSAQQSHLHSPNLWYKLEGTVGRGCVVLVSGTHYFSSQQFPLKVISYRDSYVVVNIAILKSSRVEIRTKNRVCNVLTICRPGYRQR